VTQEKDCSKATSKTDAKNVAQNKGPLESDPCLTSRRTFSAKSIIVNARYIAKCHILLFLFFFFFFIFFYFFFIFYFSFWI